MSSTVASSNVALDLARQEYQDIVTLCADTDSSLELSNRHIGHAAILFRESLKRTRTYMEIFTGKLPELFIHEIKESLYLALDRGAQITVAFVDPPKSNHYIFSIKGERKNFTVMAVRPDYRDLVAKNMCHFFVSDDKRYRMEKLHPADQDFETDLSISAVASFNQPKAADRLHGSFQKILTLCAPLVG